MSTTANTICTGALLLCGVIDPEDPASAQMLADAYRRLNLMMGQWSIQSLTIPVVAREVFPIVSNKGGPSNPYTVGPGGDLNTTRPLKLEGAGLLLNTNPTLPVEIPRALLTDDAYEAIAIKDLTNPLFTNVYYNATFTGGLGQLFLWPIPTNAANSLVLYRKQQLGLFTSPTASYDLPEGADEAIEYNLAKRLLDVYSVPVDRKVNLIDQARTSLAIYKRANTKLTDRAIDQIFVPNERHGGYNINVGNG